MDGCDDCTTMWMYLISLRWFNGEANGTPLQYSCLENPMDGGAWWAAVHGVTKSRTRLSDFTFTFHFSALEKEMAPHSSVLAWRIPGTGEPGGVPSMGSHRVRHDWSDLAAAAAHGLMEKGMAIHSSILAWRITWTEKPDRLYSPCGCLLFISCLIAIAFLSMQNLWLCGSQQTMENS